MPVLLLIGVSTAIISSSMFAGYRFVKFMEKRKREDNDYDLYDYDI